MKYNINHSKPELNDSDIEKYQNFEQLLKDYESASKTDRSRKLIYYWTGLGLILLVVISGYYYWKIEIDNSISDLNIEQSNDEQKRNLNPSIIFDSASSEFDNEILDDQKTIPIEKTTSAELAPNIKDYSYKNEAKIKSAKEEKLLETEHYEYIDAFPIIGFDSLYEYFESQIVVHDSLKGTVNVQFVVTKNGLINQVNVVKSVNHFADSVAIHLVTNMSDWRPAIVNQQPVNSKLVIPITFEPIDQ